MEFKRTRRRGPRPDILPMIDVVFFLLVFFMLFSTLRSAELGIDVELPRASSGDTQAAERIEVGVGLHGILYLDGRQITAVELRAQLTERLTAHPNTFIIVKADRDVRYEHVIEALDHVRGAGGHNMGLAVEPKT